MPCVRAIIHLNNLRHNIRLLRERAGGREICLAVKADAYGHGAVRIVQEAERCGIRSFGVSRISEAAELRDAGVASNILLFSPASREDMPYFWEYDVQPFLPNREYFRELVNVWAKGRSLRKRGGKAEGEQSKQIGSARSGRSQGLREHRLKVHLKIDTGMGRIGCAPSDALSIASEISAQEGFALEGIASHYPRSDSPGNAADADFCNAQIAQFQLLRAGLEERGIRPASFHIANSGGLLGYPKDACSLVRPGIAAYGYHPAEPFAGALQAAATETGALWGEAALHEAGAFQTSEQTSEYPSDISDLYSLDGAEPSQALQAVELREAGVLRSDPSVSSTDLALLPVMELRAEISHIKRVQAGQGISYGHTWRSTEPSYIATLGIGYADGYPRIVSNKARVLVHGRACAQVGNICMDQCMIDLGASVGDVKLFNEAVMFGPDGRGESAASIAAQAGTIPYEITCGISSRVQREYVD